MTLFWDEDRIKNLEWYKDHHSDYIKKMEKALRMFGGESARLTALESAVATLLEQAGIKRDCTPSSDRDLVEKVASEKARRTNRG